MKKFLSLISLVGSIVLAMFCVTPALANTFADGTPQAVPYTYNGTTYDRYIVISRTSYSICSNTKALYFVSSEMTNAGYPTSTNAYSLVRYYPGDTPALLTQPNGSHLLIFDAYNNSGVCTWNTTPDTETTFQQIYTLRADAAEAIHDLNFTLHVQDNGAYTLPYTFSSPYTDWGSWGAADSILKAVFRNAAIEGFLQSSGTGGQCVPYVRDETGIPYAACNTDGEDCFDQADGLGFRTGNTPEVGAIIVLGGNVGGVPSPGHVGIVKQINSGTSIVLHDSNWVAANTVGEHTINPNNFDVKGYIYPQP